MLWCYRGHFFVPEWAPNEEGYMVNSESKKVGAVTVPDITSILTFSLHRWRMCQVSVLQVYRYILIVLIIKHVNMNKSDRTLISVK